MEIKDKILDTVFEIHSPSGGTFGLSELDDIAKMVIKMLAEKGYKNRTIVMYDQDFRRIIEDDGNE